MTLRSDDPSFSARLTAARHGDGAAWSQLYHELAPLVIGYLRAQRLPDADDVAGEVFLEVVRDLHRFRGDAANLRSWVLSIAHHRLLDARRREVRRPLSDLGDHLGREPVAQDDPEAEAMASLAFCRLEPALTVLTEEQRTVLLLRVVGDLSVAEVARIVGKRPGAVKQLQRRAAEAMRRCLDRSGAVLAEVEVTGPTPAQAGHGSGPPPNQAHHWYDQRAERTVGGVTVSRGPLDTLVPRDGRSDRR